jgi:hypothetical protein
MIPRVQRERFDKLQERFQAHEACILRLFKESDYFRSLCMHHGAALNGIQTWTFKSEVARQFHFIAAEIEMEVDEILQLMASGLNLSEILAI